VRRFPCPARRVTVSGEIAIIYLDPCYGVMPGDLPAVVSLDVTEATGDRLVLVTLEDLVEELVDRDECLSDGFHCACPFQRLLKNACSALIASDGKAIGD